MNTLPLSELLDAEETLMLCATVRLSQSLRQSYAKLQMQTGKTQWSTLNCQTVEQWLDWVREELVLRGLQTPALHCIPLDSTQQSLLWETIIREDMGDEAASDLFDVPALASTAVQAHELATTWDMVIQPSGVSEETQRFLSWQDTFKQHCEENQWIDPASLAQAVVHALADLNTTLCLPRQVVFAGFSRNNPVEIRLKEVLAKRGVTHAELAAEPLATSIESRRYPDTKAECLAAALWAQERLNADPKAMLAMVVPDLSGTRHLLQDTLEDILDPVAIRPCHAEAPRPFNVSLGQPLSSFPLVSTGLKLLEVWANAHSVEQTELSALLRNPFWSAYGCESESRARLDALVRTGLGPATSLQQVVAFIQNAAKDKNLLADQLMSHVAALLRGKDEVAQRQSPSAWSRALPEILRQSGWLHDRQLSSHEYQAREAFAATMTQLSRLDGFLSTVDGRQVIGLLTRMCRERVFQPQTEGRPRLHVLGLLEASGLRFDAVWVMGMNETTWPPRARPNPLLPSAAQRQVRSPNASADVQLEFARSVQQSLERSAPEVVFSWPHTEGASELNASSLIPPTKKENELPAPLSPHWTFEALTSTHKHLADSLDDAMAPRVEEGAKVSGGTWLLRAQAICPAWGYYQFRLGAVALEEPIEGLDARQRGTFVHDVLELIWKEVHTQAELKALSEAQRRDIVSRAVNQVLKSYADKKNSKPLSSRLEDLERTRLNRLIMGWLDIELERTSPFTVLAAEREVNFDIEGIRGRMKIDRIDQLDNSEILVIDYKTGASIDTKNWSSDRLTEPQLPIYASIEPPTEGPVKGVVFAKVLMNEPGWAGLAETDKVLPKVHGLASTQGKKLFPPDKFPDWSSVLQHWKSAIFTVAREVKAGDAGVRFDDEKSLKYCDVQPLLRLAERKAQLAAAMNKQPGSPA